MTGNRNQILGNRYEAAAIAAGWHMTATGWVADDQDPDTGYPDVEYATAEELCRQEGIEA